MLYRELGHVLEDKGLKKGKNLGQPALSRPPEAIYEDSNAGIVYAIYAVGIVVCEGGPELLRAMAGLGKTIGDL